MYGLFMAEVAVEKATGKTQVEKLTCVADIGELCNQLIVDGQIYGGLAQGVGLALSEDYEDIKKQSTMVGAGIPSIQMIPDEMEIVYVKTPRKDGPHGASGVGEMPLTAPHPAIINAIYNACGARITHLPAYPEKVLEPCPSKTICKQGEGQPPPCSFIRCGPRGGDLRVNPRRAILANRFRPAPGVSRA